MDVTMIDSAVEGVRLPMLHQARRNEC